jgi:hypothetical protein
MIIFPVGILMSQTATSNSQYFLLTGGALLIIVYLIRFYGPILLTDQATPVDLFSHKELQQISLGMVVLPPPACAIRLGHLFDTCFILGI